MRHRFDQQLSLGITPIQDTVISHKSKGSLTELLAALLTIYMTPEYNERIFQIMDKYITAGKNKTGRTGMPLWQIFVLAQVRLCENISYEKLHNYTNNHIMLRGVLGINGGTGNVDIGWTTIQLEYQNIYDNVSALNENMLKEINQVILDFGHEKVFKKKEVTALVLKSDSFVVESNVHFPTDYNLLFDSARKVLDVVSEITKKHNYLTGWRKISNWYFCLKGQMREFGKTTSSGGKNKEEREKKSAQRYLTKAKALVTKVKQEKETYPLEDMKDLSLLLSLDLYLQYLEKHIDLLERRVIKGEKIPHHEKMFSIFETYTEFIKKGKRRPNVELGKKLNITTDQYHLIVDYQIMEHQQDRDIVLEIADRILLKYKVKTWSFDKGYWNKDNKEILSTMVEQVVMPKLGKRTKSEIEQERSRSFKKYKNKHSAVESNINELEHRGLDRVPDRGYAHFKNYIGLGVCAYNLKKIGKEVLKECRKTPDSNIFTYKQVA